MSPPLTCDNCRGGELWKIARVYERGAPGWVQLGALDDIAPLATTVCCACKHVGWYARPTAKLREVPRQRQRVVVDASRRCRVCSGTSRLLVAQLHEEGEVTHAFSIDKRRLAVAARDGSGRFALEVCDGCGVADWFACDVAATDGMVESGACSRCLTGKTRSLRPVRESGGGTIPVAVIGETPYGEFEVRWCEECGACDWRAHHIDELRPVGEHIVRVEASQERLDLAGGPYR
jgi:hypothetical protein